MKNYEYLLTKFILLVRSGALAGREQASLEGDGLQSLIIHGQCINDAHVSYFILHGNSINYVSKYLQFFMRKILVLEGMSLDLELP